MTDQQFDPADPRDAAAARPVPELTTVSPEDQPYDRDPADLEPEDAGATTTDDLTVSLDESDH